MMCVRLCFAMAVLTTASTCCSMESNGLAHSLWDGRINMLLVYDGRYLLLADRGVETRGRKKEGASLRRLSDLFSSRDVWVASSRPIQGLSAELAGLGPGTATVFAIIPIDRISEAECRAVEETVSAGGYVMARTNKALPAPWSSATSTTATADP